MFEPLVKDSTIADSPHVLLAVTGSIAAFKGAALASELVKSGFEVRVIMTDGATHFITPLTFEALTANPVATSIWDETPGSSRMGHLSLARWADVLVVAPASAAAIAGLAIGSAGDLLGATALACRAPLVLAPAMETAMFEHPALQAHLDVLLGRGAQIVGPERGRLASGVSGLGRMAEPSEIVAKVRSVIGGDGDLSGVRVLISAGPTYEAIDRVRFIGNRSSGKMGFALARQARSRGAQVTLVSGPTALDMPEGVDFRSVESAVEMQEEILRYAPSSDAVIMAAAVADFRPSKVVDGKIRRIDALSLELTPTEDIAAAAVLAAPSAVHIGFALEAGTALEAARRKLERKGLDLVVANVIDDNHNPFGSATNRVTLVTSSGHQELPELDKNDVASRILDELVTLLAARGPSS